jgi:thymidylate kinase
MQMDGPQCRRALTVLNKVSRLHKWLAQCEASYYEQIRLPDLMIVLKLQPELAVQRKKQETELSVHARSSEVWKLDWDEKSARVIDASLPRNDVLAQAQALVWEHL